jgi:hypothetical protein
MITTNDDSDKEKEITQTSEDESQWSPWPDEEIWLDMLEPVLTDKPDLADMLCELWYSLRERAQGSERDIRSLCETLDVALDVTMPFTPAYKAFKELNDMSLAGDLTDENLPVTVLSNAITRARAKSAAWGKERMLAKQQVEEKPKTKVPRTSKKAKVKTKKKG